MVKWQGRSKRKSSGGKLKHYRKKRKYEYGREAAHTRIGSLKRKVIRVMGGNKKVRLIKSDVAVVTNPETGKVMKVKLEHVEKNSANRHFKRSNIITKGAIVKTDKGLIKVTNRPGQEGHVQGVLIKE